MCILCSKASALKSEVVKKRPHVTSVLDSPAAMGKRGASKIDQEIAGDLAHLDEEEGKYSKKNYDRSMEYAKRSMEKNLTRDSLEDVEWKSMQGKSRSHRRRQQEFIKKWKDSKGFQFVYAEKEAIEKKQNSSNVMRGFFTASKISEFESWNEHATRNIVAHAIEQGWVERDNVRKEELYWYDGLEEHNDGLMQEDVLTTRLRSDEVRLPGESDSTYQTNNVSFRGHSIKKC